MQGSGVGQRAYRKQGPFSTSVSANLSMFLCCICGIVSVFILTIVMRRWPLYGHAITSYYKLSAAVPVNYFLRGFPRVFWCACMICFLCDMNIQQIVLLADNQHALVNKHGHNSRIRISLLQSGPQCIYHVPL